MGSTELVTDMHVNYLTPEKLYLFTNLELPKICVIFTVCLKMLDTEIYKEYKSDEILLYSVGISLNQRIHSSKFWENPQVFDLETIVQKLSNLEAKLKFRICNCFL